MNWNRRAWMTAMLAAPVAGSAKFRWAICSETFPGATFADVCRLTRSTGYTGLEIDPSNLSDDPASMDAAARKALRKTMSEHGVEFAGLHSFLKAPKGLHLTTADDAVRSRSWEYFDRLIDLAADLGERPAMVLGSSKQRQAVDVSPTQAVEHLVAGLSRMGPHAERRGVTILMEPLAPHLCNVVNTLGEALRVADRASSPAIQTMFDTHNTTAETEPHAELIRRHIGRIRHVHLNELDGRYPGSGGFPFAPVLNALRDAKYRGWLSVEVFDFKPDGETVARNAIEFLRRTASEY